MKQFAELSNATLLFIDSTPPSFWKYLNSNTRMVHKKVLAGRLEGLYVILASMAKWLKNTPIFLTLSLRSRGRILAHFILIVFNDQITS